MNHVLTLSIIFTFMLLAFSIGAVQSKLYRPEERANLSCRFNREQSSLANENTLAEIDNKLNSLYSKINQTVGYGEACNYSIEFVFEFLNETATTGTKVVAALAQLLEGFGILRERYIDGLWGYCAAEGAEELIKNITEVDNVATNAPIFMCDRSQLLRCHARYKKCQCLVDNKDFREFAAEYWDDEEEAQNTDGHVSIGRSLCVLSIGSDCPRGNDSLFMCEPHTSCRNKGTKEICNNLHLIDFKAGQNLSDASPMNDATSIATSTERAVGLPWHRRNNEYFANVHCQCFGYIGGSADAIFATTFPETCFWRTIRIIKRTWHSLALVLISKFVEIFRVDS